jgi:xanthine dehydrogenase iron-sulfur cluster and FAD-binding subunit A
MIMAAVSLGRKPTLEQMKTGLAGNLCRCTGYAAIYRSIGAASTGKNRRGRRVRGSSVDLETKRKNRGDRGEREGLVAVRHEAKRRRERKGRNG